MRIRGTPIFDHQRTGTCPAPFFASEFLPIPIIPAWPAEVSILLVQSEADVEVDLALVAQANRGVGLVLRSRQRQARAAPPAAQ